MFKKLWKQVFGKAKVVEPAPVRTIDLRQVQFIRGNRIETKYIDAVEYDRLINSMKAAHSKDIDESRMANQMVQYTLESL